MRVADLPLSDELVAHFEGQGIERCYPPQAAAVDANVCDGGNVVAAIPTAAGKTFVAQLAMLTADGPGLYIVPLRALAREKYETFDALPGLSVGISTGDFDSPAAELGEYDVVVATSEKVDSAIRNGADWVDRLASVVVDEIHLLGAEGRGPTLEVTLATLRRRVPDVQVVGLSATVDNPGEIASWLDATLVESTWRPVDLRTGVYANREIRFDDGDGRELFVKTGLDGKAGRTVPAGRTDDGSSGEESGDDPADADATNAGYRADVGESDDRDEIDDTEAAVALAHEAVDDGGQCLVFVSSRREAESLARRMAKEGFGEAETVADDLAEMGAAGTADRLADCVREGVAFHHAGLQSAHRAAVESAFRDRKLSVICATPTLAAGVNVPARRVVVRDQRRYTGSEMTWLPTLEVHQMCGRAGRPHLDPYGEAVLVGDETTREALWERYVEGEPEAVESKLADPAALRTHVLSLAATGAADSEAAVLDLLSETFYAHQTPESDLSGVVGDAVADLAALGMLDADAAGDGSLVATALGGVTSRQYVTPETGARLVEGLETAATMPAATGLTALEVVCDTPDMQDTYLGNRERAEMYEYARRHADQLTTGMTEADDFETWLESVKTARILHEYAEGASVADLVDRFRIGPGDLESRVERAEWLLGAADAFASLLGLDLPQAAAVRRALASR